MIDPLIKTLKRQLLVQEEILYYMDNLKASVDSTGMGHDVHMI